MNLLDLSLRNPDRQKELIKFTNESTICVICKINYKPEWPEIATQDISGEKYHRIGLLVYAKNQQTKQWFVFITEKIYGSLSSNPVNQSPIIGHVAWGNNEVKWKVNYDNLNNWEATEITYVKEYTTLNKMGRGGDIYKLLLENCQDFQKNAAIPNWKPGKINLIEAFFNQTEFADELLSPPSMPFSYGTEFGGEPRSTTLHQHRPSTELNVENKTENTPQSKTVYDYINEYGSLLLSIVMQLIVAIRTFFWETKTTLELTLRGISFAIGVLLLVICFLEILLSMKYWVYKVPVLKEVLKYARVCLGLIFIAICSFFHLFKDILE